MYFTNYSFNILPKIGITNTSSASISIFGKLAGARIIGARNRRPTVRLFESQTVEICKLSFFKLIPA